MNVETATLRLQHEQNRVHRLRGQINQLQISLEIAEAAARDAHQALTAAKAAADSDAYPVGTRVRHHFWKGIKGTVVESDGTGIAVQQDGIDHPSYGFGRLEWEVI